LYAESVDCHEQKSCVKNRWNKIHADLDLRI
jgi:hypothetical protein